MCLMADCRYVSISTALHVVMRCTWLQIVGFDDICTNDPVDAKGVVINQIKRIRESRYLCHAHIFVMIELQGGTFTPQEYYNMLNSTECTFFMPGSVYKYDNEQVGVPTGAREKEYMKQRLEYLLHNDKLAVAEELLPPYQPRLQVNPMTANDIRKVHEKRLATLMRQMHNYRVEVKVVNPGTAMEEVKRSYTGKGGGADARDDQVISLQIGAYWGWVIRKQPGYELWEQNRIV